MRLSVHPAVWMGLCTLISSATSEMHPPRLGAFPTKSGINAALHLLLNIPKLSNTLSTLHGEVVCDPFLCCFCTLANTCQACNARDGSSEETLSIAPSVIIPVHEQIEQLVAHRGFSDPTTLIDPLKVLSIFTEQQLATFDIRFHNLTSELFKSTVYGPRYVDKLNPQTHTITPMYVGRDVFTKTLVFGLAQGLNDSPTHLRPKLDERYKLITVAPYFWWHIAYDGNPANQTYKIPVTIDLRKSLNARQLPQTSEPLVYELVGAIVAEATIEHAAEGRFLEQAYHIYLKDQYDQNKSWYFCDEKAGTTTVHEDAHTLKHWPQVRNDKIWYAKYLLYQKVHP